MYVYSDYAGEVLTLCLLFKALRRLIVDLIVFIRLYQVKVKLRVGIIGVFISLKRDPNGKNGHAI